MFLPDFLEKIVLSFRAFCREQKKIEITKSGQYGEWSKTDQSKSNIFFQHDYC